MTVIVAPSILSADFSCLGHELKRLEQAKADYIHIDVMDGHFVPNLTFGAPVVKAIRRYTNIPFDVHLMIEHPEYLIPDFVNAGADIITVHAEACTHLHRVLQMIRENGKKVGVALNPSTPLSTIEYVLEDVDLVLLMSVNPGFGGQPFIRNVVQKIIRLKEILHSAGIKPLIEVDGGIKEETGRLCVQAGANVLVAGSYVFSAEEVYKPIQLLHSLKEDYDVHKKLMTVKSSKLF